MSELLSKTGYLSEMYTVLFSTYYPLWKSRHLRKLRVKTEWRSMTDLFITLYGVIGTGTLPNYFDVKFWHVFSFSVKRKGSGFFCFLSTTRHRYLGGRRGLPVKRRRPNIRSVKSRITIHPNSCKGGSWRKDRKGNRSPYPVPILTRKAEIPIDPVKPRSMRVRTWSRRIVLEKRLHFIHLFLV